MLHRMGEFPDFESCEAYLKRLVANMGKFISNRRGKTVLKGQGM